MYTLINEYKKSSQLVRERIKILTEQKNILMHSGKTDDINAMDLERRLRLLYTENAEITEIIEHLEKYTRRVAERVKA